VTRTCRTSAPSRPPSELLFDLNDFDETLPGPWEWDVKRLAASFALAGRGRGLSASERRSVLLAVARSYRETMRRFANMGNLQVWYSMLTAETLTRALSADKAPRKKRVQTRARKAESKAEAKDSLRAFNKLTTVVDGRLQIVSDPPLIVRAVDLLPAGDAGSLTEEVHQLVRRYRATLPADRRHLLEGYRLVDLARKVVGVGSVGTRARPARLARPHEEDVSLTLTAQGVHHRLQGMTDVSLARLFGFARPT
jgi:uncharacterized protein (DUF2252 family)